MTDQIGTETDIEFWRLPTVMAKVGLSRSEIYKRARLGEFPTSRKYPGSDMAFWLSSDVRRWQLALISVAPARTS